ncbi:hypothetical protein MDOR_15160 [Mycolicibacterium doricum]|uniref:Uncharacterized protein n=1 Tax=Mycolicibacterium doricum TaxID=126673 RepID=A0A7I7VR07_9MYCO|nr:hypothetical protein MDOR_15160 [Mycolicibacterium doricum]
MPDRFVGHLVRGALVDDIADRDEQRGAECQQRGDIRPGHRISSSSSGHERAGTAAAGANRRAEGVRTPSTDLFQ